MATKIENSLIRRKIIRKKRGYAQEVNFRRSIRKVLAIIEPNLSMKPKATAIINDALNVVNIKLIENCNKKYRPNKRQPEMNVEVAYTAVKNEFRNEIQKHALAAGQKALARFIYGLTSYTRKTPKDTRKKSPSRKTRVSWGQEFNNGIQTIAKIVYPEAKIDPKSKKMMCVFLNVLFAKLISKIKALNSNTVAPVDVKSAVETIFPQVMAEHAKSEGSKMVFTLEINALTFAPKYRKPRSRITAGGRRSAQAERVEALPSLLSSPSRRRSK
ncbi:uncharacterized protein LOC118190939 [Stegodyphus dumicola]|uniref:uncharacterized protein LOC118190939 n=1 Tax=Stegodyphus dumicola TaxID=202533 RepID=UPI0015B0DB39|nr:uncharacterized protein LOC118190939 [Stegodyphus dumicola]